MISSAFIPELRVVEAGEPRVLPDAAKDRVEVWEGNGVDAYGYAAAEQEWIHLPRVATFRYGADAPSEVVAIPEEGSSPELVLDAYQRNILPLVLQMSGTQVLHASAVRSHNGVLAFCGRSGAGKSTLTDALSRRGYEVFADDAVALDIGGHGVNVLRLPYSLRLDAHPPTPPEHLTTVPTSRTDDASVRLCSIVVLDRSEDSGTPVIDLEPLAPAAAFTALLPHAYYYRLADRLRNEELVGSYLRLVSEIPVWSARIVHDLAKLPVVLDRLEERVAGVFR